MIRRKTLSIWIAGAAGDGIASIGESLAKIAARQGFHLFAYNSFQSVIRGGHVWFQLRAGPEKVFAHRSKSCHLLIALNQDAIARHALGVEPGGGILYNADRVQLSKDAFLNGVGNFGLPISKLGAAPLMQNTAAMGALVALVGLPFASLEEILRQRFSKKGDDVVRQNLAAAQAGFDHAKANWKPIVENPPLHPDQGRMLMTGNQLIAMGALVGGCRFYSAYPMTPASSIMHTLTPRGKKYGLVFKQCEDEIAAVNAAIGAGHSGVRAMTGTSGGGFSLMTEAVGLAGMMETPVVIVNAMRGGPSTGLPTKTEQGDLFQAIGASQGEYPRIILALTSMEDAFYTPQRALNFAEKFQCPVILLSDFLLSEHMETVEPLDLKAVPIERGNLLREWPAGEPYFRYRITPSGVSPRVLPGTPNAIHVAASDEHNQRGDVISDVATNPAVRRLMMEKRMRKMIAAKQELEKLYPVALEGHPNAEVTLIGWGSNCALMKAMARRLGEEGLKANLLLIRVIAPFLTESVKAALDKVKLGIILENNYTGQLERLIRMETGHSISCRIHQYDGEPFDPEEVWEAVRDIVSSGIPGTRVTAGPKNFPEKEPSRG